MSHTALIRFAPVLTVDRLNDPRWLQPGRKFYDPSSLRFLPSKTLVPLLVDHDEGRQIGRVDRLYTLDCGDGPWICANATIDIEPPHWLRRGSGASFGFKILHERKALFAETSPDVISHALVDEVSVLSPSEKPAEPFARVMLLEREAARTRSPAVGSDRLAAGEVIHGGGLLHRPAVGRVLAVGGVPERSSASRQLQRSGADWVIDHADGSSTIYCGPEGYREAIRDGLVRCDV